MNRTTWAAIGIAVLATGAVGVVVGRMSADRPATHAAGPDRPAGNGQAVALTQSRVQAAGIELVRVERRDLAAEVIAQGTAASAAGAEGVLAARADGTVMRLFKRLGDPVRAGETVALIESREASTIAAERAKALAEVQNARAKYAREKRLFDAGVTARQDLEAARAELSGAEAEATRTGAAAAAARVSGDGRSVAVVSPVTGRISAAAASLGAYVNAGAEIYRVVNPGKVEIRATATAEDASRIALGDAATFEAGNLQGAATVRAVTPDVDPVGRSVTIVLAPSAGADGLRAGSSVRVRIAARGASVSLVVVPIDAVQLVGGREVVFVRTKEGFRVQPVTVGQRSNGLAAISAGLSPGDIVAGRGAFLVKAELEKAPSEEDGQ